MRKDLEALAHGSNMILHCEATIGGSRSEFYTVEFLGCAMFSLGKSFDLSTALDQFPISVGN